MQVADQRLLISDLYGRQVVEVKLQGNQQDINLGNQPNGMYYYQYVVDGAHMSNGKIELLR